MDIFFLRNVNKILTKEITVIATIHAKHLPCILSRYLNHLSKTLQEKKSNYNINKNYLVSVYTQTA